MAYSGTIRFDINSTQIFIRSDNLCKQLPSGLLNILLIGCYLQLMVVVVGLGSIFFKN